MKRNDLFVLIFGAIVVGCICFFCGIQYNSTKGSVSKNVDKELYNVIKDSAEELVSIETPYLVVTTTDLESGMSQYIECFSGDESYTEYSVDEDNNLGTVMYGSTDKISYLLVDWLMEDGTYYLVDSDSDLRLSSTYGNMVKDRESMFVNTMLDSFVNIEYYDDVTIDLGRGNELLTCYRCELDSETTKSILGVSSKGIYDSLLVDYSKDTHLGRLCQYYSDDLNMRLTFSNADVIIGIDKDGILKYVSLVAGGLGSKIYYTKYVATTDNSANLRNRPDFSNSILYADSLKDLANYCASYDSIEDALYALELESESSDSSVSEEVDE